MSCLLIASSRRHLEWCNNSCYRIKGRPVLFINHCFGQSFHSPSYYHYTDVIMGTVASQITIVYWTVYSGADQRKHQSSASLAFVWGSHRGPVNSPHKGPVTQKVFPFDDVIMVTSWCDTCSVLSMCHITTSPWWRHQNHCWFISNECARTHLAWNTIYNVQTYM